MTEPEARTKPISEVWAELMRVKGCFDGRKPKIINATELLNFDMLRAVLLERCEKEWGILIAGDCASMPPRTEMSAYVADEFISALAFMAWELKQMGNELQKG